MIMIMRKEVCSTQKVDLEAEDQLEEDGKAFERQENKH